MAGANLLAPGGTSRSGLALTRNGLTSRLATPRAQPRAEVTERKATFRPFWKSGQCHVKKIAEEVGQPKGNTYTRAMSMVNRGTLEFARRRKEGLYPKNRLIDQQPIQPPKTTQPHTTIEYNRFRVYVVVGGIHVFTTDRLVKITKVKKIPNH